MPGIIGVKKNCCRDEIPPRKIVSKWTDINLVSGYVPKTPKKVPSQITALKNK